MSPGGAKPAVTPSRLIRASRAAVYRACCDPNELVRWRVPHDMSARLLGVDGASYRMSLGYDDGRADTFSATFVVRVPHEKIVERIRFEAAERAGEMILTTTLAAVDGGTEVSVSYEQLPSGIDAEANDEGTRQALERLAELVEVPPTSTAG